MEVSYTSYLDVRQDKLVLVSRRVTEGYYNDTKVIDVLVGTLLDIIV